MPTLIEQNGHEDSFEEHSGHQGYPGHHHAGHQYGYQEQRSPYGHPASPTPSGPQYGYQGVPQGYQPGPPLPPLNRPNSVVQQRYPNQTHGAYIPQGPVSNRSAGSGSDTSSQGQIRGKVGPPPPLKKPSADPYRPQQDLRPASTVPDSAPAGGIPGYDPAAVRAANMARAEALAAHQREEAAAVQREEMMIRMQQMAMDPRSQQMDPRSQQMDPRSQQIDPRLGPGMDPRMIPHGMDPRMNQPRIPPPQNRPPPPQQSPYQQQQQHPPPHIQQQQFRQQQGYFDQHQEELRIQPKPGKPSNGNYPPPRSQPDQPLPPPTHPKPNQTYPSEPLPPPPAPPPKISPPKPSISPESVSPPPPLEHQGQPTSLSHEQFRAALQMVVSAGDPRYISPNFYALTLTLSYYFIFSFRDLRYFKRNEILQ